MSKRKPVAIAPQSFIPGMISCIMPTTATRLPFLAQALKLFQAQDYPLKELVIVQDTTVDEDMSELVPDEPYIQFINVDMLLSDCGKLSIGAKRNLACSLARGEYIAFWDDDDYFGPQRLSKQVEPLLTGRADVTALRMTHMLCLADTSLWHLWSEDEHARLFKHDVRSGTLLFKASYWREEGVSFRNRSRGEDVQFLHDLLAQGARLEQVLAPHEYICVRHDNNTTDALTPAYPGWLRASLSRTLSEQDMAFYQSFRKENT